MRPYRLVTALRFALLVACFAGLSFSQAQDVTDPFKVNALLAPPGASDESTATLISEVTAVAPGKPFSVAVRIDLPPKWHSYYRNQGAGVENVLKLDWQLPPGMKAGEIQWPTPEVIEGFVGKSFAYEGSPVFLVELMPTPDLKVGETLKLAAKATWQICSDVCKDQQADLSLNVPIAAQATIDPAQQSLFTEARQHTALATTGWTISAEKTGADYQLRLKPKAGDLPELNPTSIRFIPQDKFVTALLDGQGATKEADGWLLALKKGPSKDLIDQPIEVKKELSGIFIGKTLGEPSKEVAYSVSSVPIVSAPAQPLPWRSLLPVLLGMFIGGLILNLMPCVFPVIGLKILGFVQQSGEDRKKIIFHGLVYTLGVLISFWVLSGVLFALRSAAATSGGEEIGWGYQLQKPWVVLSLMVLMFVMALSLYGVFEIGASATSTGASLQDKSGYSGSFFSGVLATVVATPCSAPFLGVAIGTAITLPAFQFFLAFTVMALGLALPYLIMAAWPKLVDLLPRPGAWMETFKQSMAFLLFATAGYLLWVYVGQIGLENMLGAVIGLTLIALAAWILGRWHLPYKSARTRSIALAATLLAFVGGIWVAKPAPKDTWEKWSPEAVQTALDEGKAVYVDFTASWCVTCQFNKKRAYPAEVKQLMKDRNIVRLKADKTNPDPIIEEELLKLGRTAIPVNVLYVPNKDPIITQTLLTADYLKELINKEVPEKK